MNDATSGISTAPKTTPSGGSSRAPRAASPTDEVAGPARPAIRRSTDNVQTLVSHIEAQSGRMPDPFPTGDVLGSGPVVGDVKVGPAGAPSTSSRSRSVHWSAPRDVMELAAQANVLATQVLNGEVPLVVARTYASVGRTIAGLLKAEIQRRQYLDGPDLTFDNDRVFDG